MGRTLDSRAHVTRLLQRTGFDAGPDAVDAARKAGFEATLERVLTPTGSDRGGDATPAPEPGLLPARNSEAQRKRAQPVKGGFYGDQPSLTDLTDDDLRATTDFRDVYATLLRDVLDTDPAKILDGHDTTLAFL